MMPYQSVFIYQYWKSYHMFDSCRQVWLLGLVFLPQVRSIQGNPVYLRDLRKLLGHSVLVLLKLELKFGFLSHHLDGNQMYTLAISHFQVSHQVDTKGLGSAQLNQFTSKSLFYYFFTLGSVPILGAAHLAFRVRSAFIGSSWNMAFSQKSYLALSAPILSAVPNPQLGN